MAKAPGKPWSKQAPRPTREGGNNLISLPWQTAETLHVYIDTKILNRLTGEYRVIAKEVTYDQLITSLTLNKKSFHATVLSSISW